MDGGDLQESEYAERKKKCFQRMNQLEDEKTRTRRSWRGLRNEKVYWYDCS